MRLFKGKGWDFIKFKFTAIYNIIRTKKGLIIVHRYKSDNQVQALQSIRKLHIDEYKNSIKVINESYESKDYTKKTSLKKKYSTNDLLKIIQNDSDE